MDTYQKFIINQLMPYGVSHSSVLSTFQSIDKRKFLPEKYQSFSFADCVFYLQDQQVLLTSKCIAKIMQIILNHYKKQPIQHILEIGTGSGFSSICWSKVVDRITTIEINNNLYNHAKETLQNFNLDNLKSVQGDAFLMYLDTPSQLKKFDCIVTECVLKKLPLVLEEHVMLGNTFFGFMGECPKSATATLFFLEDNKLKSKRFFETSSTPIIHPELKKNMFTF